MKKLVVLLAAGMLLTGCVYNSKVSTRAEQLQQHRFVLSSVNGQAWKSNGKPPELNFSKGMTISGNMCNHFSGDGKVSDGELKAKTLTMSRIQCADPQLNTLDRTLDAMLREGAQVDLTENQLTLATVNETLIYTLAG